MFHGRNLKEMAALFVVKDVVASAEYYRDRLGFTFNQYWGDPPCFVMVQREGMTFMLQTEEKPGEGVQPNHLRQPHAWDAYIWANDGQALLEEFRANGANIIREPETTFYGMVEFEVQDPDGYVICFGQDAEEE